MMKSFFDGREYHCFQTRPGPRPGSPGRPGQFFFFKSKRCRFSKKIKQKSTGRNRVFDWVNWVVGSTHRVFPSPIFSSTQPDSSPRRSGSGSTRRAGPGFKTMGNTTTSRLQTRAEVGTSLTIYVWNTNYYNCIWYQE